MVKKIESDSDRNGIIQYLERLNIDKPWIVKIVRFRKKRSLSQNSLYHLWKAVIADEYGYSPAEMHDVLRKKFLPVNEVEIRGKKYELLCVNENT